MNPETPFYKSLSLKNSCNKIHVRKKRKI